MTPDEQEQRRIWERQAPVLLAKYDELLKERDLVYGELNKALGSQAPKAWDRIKAALHRG